MADDQLPLGTDELSQMLAGGDAPTANADHTAQRANESLDDVQVLLNQANQAMSSVPTGEEPERFEFRDLRGTSATTESASLELLQDVELELKVELARAEMSVEDVLKLGNGSVVALDKLAGDPVDVIVNGRLIARGEVVVMNDNFCIRVTQLITGDELD
ncbi:MAG: flagellar motor switch protein FliN/FliY [Pirellulaceae bacterium]|jgi:flagellar motor switch protein FliN/FliY